MKTVRLTMSQALLRFLDAQYVSLDGQEYKFIQGVFGIFGHGNVTGIGEALEYDGGSLQYIQGKNEQGMVHAATAFAKHKNRLQAFACTTSIGPGALNMVTGAATATVNRIPVLLLPSDNFACRQPDPVLQQIENAADYTISATDAFKPVSKYWDRIVRPEQLMTAAMQAMRVLTDPVETGAVTLALPQDVQAEAYDYPVDFFEKRVHYIERRPISQEACKRAVDLIKNKKRPLVIVGGGAHYSLAYQQVAELAERFQIPVVETQAGKGTMPWNHPQYLGAIGVTGSSAANRIAKEADIILAVGTRMGDFATSSKSAFQNPDVEFLSINVSRFDALKLDALEVVADAKEALTALTAELASNHYRSSYSEEEIRLAKAEWDAEVDRLYTLELQDGFAQTHAIGVVNRFVEERDVIVNAAGSMPGDLHRLWRSTQPKTYHMEYGFSCMGYEIAGALGVKLADPDRNVYAFVGDGSYLMLHSEIVTSIQEGQKITVLLFNNHGFQCIHNLQRGHGSEGFGNEFRHRSDETGRLTGDYLTLDFAANARSLGAKAYTATNAKELQEALEQAKQETMTTLIEIQVLPGTNTDGYESWWRVGVAEVSKSQKVQTAYQRMREQVGNTKPF